MALSRPRLVAHWLQCIPAVYNSPLCSSPLPRVRLLLLLLPPSSSRLCPLRHVPAVSRTRRPAVSRDAAHPASARMRQSACSLCLDGTPTLAATPLPPTSRCALPSSFLLCRPHRHSRSIAHGPTNTNIAVHRPGVEICARKARNTVSARLPAFAGLLTSSTRQNLLVLREYARRELPDEPVCARKPRDARRLRYKTAIACCPVSTTSRQDVCEYSPRCRRTSRARSRRAPKTATSPALARGKAICCLGSNSTSRGAVGDSGSTARPWLFVALAGRPENRALHARKVPGSAAKNSNGNGRIPPAAPRHAPAGTLDNCAATTTSEAAKAARPTWRSRDGDQ